jgi:hypothetical protein
MKERTMKRSGSGTPSSDETETGRAKKVLALAKTCGVPQLIFRRLE